MILKCRFSKWVLWICIFVISNFLSCSKSSDSGSNSNGQLFIKLVDTPTNIQQLKIVVDLVWIHRIGADANIGWTTVSSDRVGPVDILSLRNGVSAQLVLNTVPAGNYDRIKLLFGPCTAIEHNSESLLHFNTAYPFEYVFDYNFEVLEGKQAQLTFDFDISRSVSRIGIDNYLFTPVIRVQNTLLSGSILGSVVDPNHNVVPTTILTWTGIDSVSTFNDTTNGSFQLSDLPENLYSIRIVPFDTISFHERRIDSLAVIRQTNNNLGAIILQRR
jgi:hypothetical protein